jgi:hypothetical protein
MSNFVIVQLIKVKKIYGTHAATWRKNLAADLAQLVNAISEHCAGWQNLI